MKRNYSLIVIFTNITNIIIRVNSNVENFKSDVSKSKEKKIRRLFIAKKRKKKSKTCESL